MIHPVKGFNIVSETKVDVFLEFPCFFHDAMNVSISLTKAFDYVDHDKLWKILKETGTPDHLTCLLRNLYADQEATVRTRYRKQIGSKLGKEYIKAVYCHPAYLTYVQSTS